MVDRRLVTDIGLALLIALPSALPAAPTPTSSDEVAGRVEADPAKPSGETLVALGAVEDDRRL